MSNVSRVNFFATIVHKKEWKDSMSGRNEDKVISVLEGIGFKCGVDFVRQHPIGERFVIDIAFINEQVAIEVDGKDHDTSKQRRKDSKRDKYLRDNNWIPIRIKDKEFFGYKGSFYKSLIKMVVSERRKQWTEGLLYEVEIPNYVDEDYE
jgi:very-short-patch-repair endonuclease